jgi:DNA polymerase III sliding clamp (beta) subunit (PCNA family)
MQLLVSQEELSTALKRASAAIDSMSPVQSALSVLLSAEGGLGRPLEVGATNGQLGLIASVPCEVKQPGRAVLSHRRLSDIVSAMPPGQIEITVDETLRATVKSVGAKRKMTMTGLPVAEYPPLEKVLETGEPLYSIEAKIFQQIASEVSFAVEEVPVKGALLLPGEDGRFQLIALSNYAMAVAIGWFLPGTTRAGAKAILLPKELLEAASVFPSIATLEFQDLETRIRIGSPGLVMVVSKLARDFPSVWRNALDGIPKEPRFRVLADSLMASVKAVAVATDVVEGKDSFVQIDLAYHEGKCLVSTRKSERQRGEDELDVDGGGTDAFRVSMDMVRFMPALRALAPSECAVYYEREGVQQTFAFRSDTLTCLVLPIGIVEGK